MEFPPAAFYVSHTSTDTRDTYKLTIRSTIPATTVITRRDLHLLPIDIGLHPRAMKRAPAGHVGPVITLAADPAAAELLEVAELVGAFGVRVDGGGVGGVVAGGGDARVGVEVRGHAVVVVYGCVLAWVPFGMADAHFEAWIGVVDDLWGVCAWWE